MRFVPRTSMSAAICPILTVRSPPIERRRWEDAFRPGDLFDENKRGTHLSEATRKALRVSYAQYLRFLFENYFDLLTKAPEIESIVSSHKRVRCSTEKNQSGHKHRYQPTSPAPGAPLDLPKGGPVLATDNYETDRSSRAAQPEKAWLGRQRPALPS